MQEYFSKWGESGTVDLKHELEQVILLITSRCLLGREVRENLLDDVATLFHDLCNGMQPVSVIFPYLLTPAHRRSDRARQRLREMFGTIIRAYSWPNGPSGTALARARPSTARPSTALCGTVD